MKSKTEQPSLPGILEAIKHDGGKPQMGLISSKFLVGLSGVLTFGAKKYQAHNWRAGAGFKYSRLYDALQRHLTAWNDCEDKDPESGLSHLYHAACMLMFLAETVETRPENDDRYHAPKRNVKALIDRSKL